MSPIYVKCLRAVAVDEVHTVKKWGQTFRNVLLRIGEVRSLVPPAVCIVALTATATKTVQQQVTSILGMRSPSIVAVSPCKHNVIYCSKNSDNIEEAFLCMTDGLKKYRTNFPRTTIYCRKLSDCGKLYLCFKKNMGRVQ